MRMNHANRVSIHKKATHAKMTKVLDIFTKRKNKTAHART